MSESTKQFSFVVFGRVISGILQGLFFLVFAYLLSPHDFGEISYFIAIAGIVSVISRFGFNQSALISRSKDNLNLTNEINFLTLIITSIAGVLLIPFNIFISVLCIGISFFTMSQHNLLGSKDYKSFMIYSIVKGILMIVVSLILFNFLQIEGIILGMAITNLSLSLPFTKNLRLSRFTHIKSNIKFFLNNFGIDTSVHLTRSIDKIIIVPLLDFTSVGLYQFNLQILLGFEMIPIALHNYLLSEESSNQRHKKIEFIALLLSIIIIIAVIFLSPIIVPLLFPEYSEGILGLQIMILSLFPLTLGSIFSAKLQARNSKNSGTAVIVKVVSFVILLFALVQFYDFIGLSIAILASYVIYAIYLGILVKK